MANPTFTITLENGGVMKGELYPEIAPQSVGNFISLANSGFYDGLIFHRCIPGFMIQGGCPEGTGMGGPGYRIKGEFSANGVKNDLKHTYGVLSMARSMMKDSAGSQFFIMTSDSPHLDGQYAAFGRVLEGMEEAEKIVSQRTDRMDRLSASSAFAWRPTAWNIPLRSCKRFPAAEGQTPFRRLFSGNEMLKGFGPEGRKCHEIESSRSGAALPCWKRRSAPCRSGQRRGRGVSGLQGLWGPGFRCEF